MSEPFYFSNCGQAAYNVEDLANLCQQFSREAIDYLNQGHFESWLSYIGETSLASKTAEIRQSQITNEEQLKQFLNACQLSPLTSESQPEQDMALPSEEESPLTSESQPKQDMALPSGGKSFQLSSTSRFRIRYFPGLGAGKIYEVGEQEIIVNYSQLSRQIQLIHQNGGKIQDIVAI
jgi:hypothetical protein